MNAAFSVLTVWGQDFVYCSITGYSRRMPYRAEGVAMMMNQYYVRIMRGWGEQMKHYRRKV